MGETFRIGGQADDVYMATETAYKNGYKDGYEAGKNAAKTQGHWIEIIDSAGVSHLFCSNCEFEEIGKCKMPYCPYCGAQMNGGTDNAEIH